VFAQNVRKMIVSQLRIKLMCSNQRESLKITRKVAFTERRLARTVRRLPASKPKGSASSRLRWSSTQRIR
jgi:hypothetical protein